MNLISFHSRSLNNKENFWREQAKNIDWFKFPNNILDYSNPPFSNWYLDGVTNLCFNAVDRHLVKRAKQLALIYVSTETNKRKTFTYEELHSEVQTMAKVIHQLGVRKGNRVLIYMPMIPEGVFAMLACARIGAIHSVVFGGFAAKPLALRIDDATPKLIITSDAGVRGGKVIPYKKIVDEACNISEYPPEKLLLVDRKISDFQFISDRDVDYDLYKKNINSNEFFCENLYSNDPSYILYTSGTTGVPKGIQRDTGGYAVALSTSMKLIYDCRPGEVFFCASDIGWVVGHSYLVYAPLINGSTTLLYEGLPTNPDSGIWWSLVDEFKITTMFTSPTAIRVLKKQDQKFLSHHKTESLRKLFLAGEPLDKPTAEWISSALSKTQIIDNYWQTETGWPILSAQLPIQKTKLKNGSASFPVYGFDIKLIDETTGKKVKAGEKGVLSIVAPLPPGCFQTVWANNERFVSTYFAKLNGDYLYSTFDYATCDDEGYFYILGRTDDVINVSGHRLGTREIEEAIQLYDNVAEAAVVGVNDSIKGQVPVAFIVLKSAYNSDITEKNTEILKIQNLVNEKLGPFAKPTFIYFVKSLPKTRSGKLLRRAIQAVLESRDVGDLTTLEDPNSLDEIKKAILTS
ncbi:MAG: propionate--CoA ligase [Betaproteobacteria bacterium TMED41]|nr:MAG: propionate--CoA ligase [Betaproteobacteria bacterium TMED41]